MSPHPLPSCRTAPRGAAAGRLAAVVLALVLCGSLPAAGDRPPPGSRRPAPAGWPSRFAWTWDRTDDLRFLPPGDGIAAVRLSIELEGAHLRRRVDHGTLLHRPDTFVLPVVHVDALARWQPALDATQEAVLAAAIADVARGGGVGAVQVDFEALPSQRTFYRHVLQRIRQQLPDTYVAITGLASWCLSDRWTAELPVDDVVGMAFRMGVDSPSYRRVLHALAAWPAPECRSTGIASDEPGGALPRSRALYLFSPRPWTPATWQTTLSDNPPST